MTGHDMKLRIAAFRYVGADHITTGTEHLEFGSDMYLRISEYVDVEFQPISSEAEVKKRSEALAKRRQKIEQDYARQVAEIEQQQSELAAH